MITKDQACNAREFHTSYQRKDGTCYVWRRNGATQTWKTRPNDFRIPVKYGLYNYGQIWQHDADDYHVAEDCPMRNAS